MIQHDVTSTSPLCGKLHTQAELDNYEQTWHSHIFLPQWNALKMNVCTCNVENCSIFNACKQDILLMKFMVERPFDKSILRYHQECIRRDLF